MKGVRFYEEYADEKTRKVSQGNVVAIDTETPPYRSGDVVCVSALSGIYMSPNAPVATTGVALSYLRENCKRISEARAREVHPALFHRLDNGER